ncbi:hypothetical protein GVX82_04270, partial [Patescibacteria group bacterium]|nr:hypothetical protein [Patescibacteria group bacterium]
MLDTMLANSGGEAEIVHVTNLNASGAGSFQEAITTKRTASNGEDMTRIVVFDVAGEITLP